MQFHVASKRQKIESVKSRYPEARIIDVTSKADLPWIRFSPFYPHGNIPVPFSAGVFAASVEGIWQGLKVFEDADVDFTKFSNVTMKGIKRSVRANGKVLGHRAGIGSQRLLMYREARYLIYLPTYKWVLETCLQPEIALLKEYAASQPIVLLDYETNDDIENLDSPLSHASLIAKFIEDSWPDIPIQF